MDWLTEHPLWRNVVARTTLYYLIAGGMAAVLYRYVPSAWGMLGGETLSDLLAPPSPTADGTTATGLGPTPLATAIAMFTAFATSLPVAWIYTLTRRKKGYQQSIVQTYLILPVVVAGIVVLVKYSLALAFSLGGIVAAVRFRTSLDDSKDAAGIFVVTGVGMAAAVAPSVSWVISGAFNALMLGLWYTDFGRPSALEGKTAEKRMQRALATANRTGMFVAKLDEEVLKSLSPEQLEAIADRAWRRRKKNASDADDDAPVDQATYEHLLRVHTHDIALARTAIEPRFNGFFRRWKYMGTVRDGELRIAEYGITFDETVTIGVVSDELRAIPESPVRKLELK
jgi:hypothetical protein